MSSDSESFNDPEDMQDIEQFAFNGNLFRSDVTFQDFALLRRTTFEDLHGELGWSNYTYGLMPVVFIDLLHVLRFLYYKNEQGYARPGLNALNLKRIAQVVCNYIGDDSDFHEELWTSFDEEVASNVMAELGMDEHDAIMSGPFSNAMEAMVEIANTIKRYLVNAYYPLIGNLSVYTVHDVKNGILALRLRTYQELKIYYGG
jgi:hypothetical protein